MQHPFADLQRAIELHISGRPATVMDHACADLWKRMCGEADVRRERDAYMRYLLRHMLLRERITQLELARRIDCRLRDAGMEDVHLGQVAATCLTPLIVALGIPATAQSCPETHSSGCG